MGVNEMVEILIGILMMLALKQRGTPVFGHTEYESDIRLSI